MSQFGGWKPKGLDSVVEYECTFCGQKFTRTENRLVKGKIAQSELSGLEPCQTARVRAVMEA